MGRTHNKSPLNNIEIYHYCVDNFTKISWYFETNKKGQTGRQDRRGKYCSRSGQDNLLVAAKLIWTWLSQYNEQIVRIRKTLIFARWTNLQSNRLWVLQINLLNNTTTNVYIYTSNKYKSSIQLKVHKAINKDMRRSLSICSIIYSPHIIADRWTRLALILWPVHNNWSQHCQMYC